MERCLRQYFYEYYATDANCPIDEDRRDRIRGFKDMTNAALLAGNLLHRFIKLSFTHKDLSEDWLQRTAMKSFDDTVQFARNPKGQAHRLREKYPPKELVEFAYEDLDGDELAERERNKLKTAFGNFFRGDDVQGYLESLEGYELMPEKRLKGLRVNGWSISGQIDLLAVNCQGCEVADWKLGTQERGTDSLQLHIYGTFAADVAQISSNEVQMRRVFLGDGVVEPAQTMDKDMAYVGRTRLLQDIELMEELHKYGQNGQEGVFTPCDHKNICRRCKFRAICHGVPLKKNSLQT